MNNIKGKNSEKKKKLKRKRIKISRSTIYAILIIIAIFLIWQFLAVPMMIGNISNPPVGQIPPIKRGDVKFVDSQISKRVLKNVPPLVPPKTELGKKNPFE